VANDTDPHAISAIGMNARLNHADVTAVAGDLLDGDGLGADVILAGDVLYSEPLATRMLRFLARQVDRGADVLVGDPGRSRQPTTWLEPIATYTRMDPGPAEDAQFERAMVLTARRRPRP
jgi:predicted nicotinamide N-methyase